MNLNSPFCGKLAHKSVIKKRRKAPDSDKILPICDKCRSLFIEKIQLSPFLDAQAQLQERIDKREETLNRTQTLLVQLESEIRTLESNVNFHC